ncbi:MAG TPA: acetoacetate--CoA ligase [Acidimicrobiales bacterium]|nr:acetoacetate--CoA ligase [Acidimicrobiales bacterium]
MASPAPIWSPPPERRKQSRLHAYLEHRRFDRYETAWDWSVSPDTAGEFWGDVADWSGVVWRRRPEALLEPDASRVPGWRWFRGARLNYAENALRPASTMPDSPAVIALSQTRPEVRLTWSELAVSVAAARTGLFNAGVTRGDRVVGYLPNIPEALVAMLAAASLGAVWSSCAPETGVTGVLDRFSQVEPKVLLAVDGYRFGERDIERREQAEAVLRGLPTVETAIWLPYLHPDEAPPPRWISWQDSCGTTTSGGGRIEPSGEFEDVEFEDIEFEDVDFEHPLYVLFSSGTTGRPKPIVHGHGGIVLEHLKALALHFDLGPADRFFWFTTTGWMMWNFCVSGLLVGSAVVLFDGDPAWPDLDSLWRLMQETGTTCAGVGSGYLVACQKAGLSPKDSYRLDGLKTLGATGSPLPSAAARWVYDHVSDDVLLAPFSGGTDVCTGFVGGSPLHPVWPGEISCRCLGADVEVFDDSGRPVVGEEGELVLAGPLPSMPVSFWGDADGSRYRSAYFERFPGVWAHGDRATLTDRGTVVITGRSDGTLNRGGVRIGTAELYAVVESLPDVADSLVVHVEDPGGGPGQIWLFVVRTPASATTNATTTATGRSAGEEPPDEPPLEEQIRKSLRESLSPRHVPDRIVVIPAIPRTLSGKKLEVPVKRILAGANPDDVLSLASVANPESLEPILALTREA